MNSFFKKAALTSALSLALPSMAMAEIIITEYVEGSGNNKVVELTNMGGSAIDMGAEGYKLALYVNGSPTEHEDRKIELTGSLAAGASYMIYNESADAEFLFPNNGAASTATFFNGDDALVLTKSGVVVDSFGRVGEDPGSAWTDANNPDWSTQNKTLRRLTSITTGDTTIDDEFPGATNQWALFDINTSDGLGCAGESACGSTPTENIVITEYIEGSSNNKAVEISNLGSSAVDLGAGKYKLAMFSNGSPTEHDTRKIEFTGMLEAGQSFVVYNDGADDAFKPAQNSAPSEVTFFNGDDALVLTRDGVIVDSFGQVGVDPGTAWTDANNADWSTANKTLRRMASVTSGDAIADDEFPGATNQWQLFDIDTADGLGCPGEGACATDGGEVPNNEKIVITEYVEGSSNNKAVEISNLGTEAVDLGAGKYKLAMFSNGSITEHETRKIEFTGMLEAGKSFVVYNASAAEPFQFPINGQSSEVTFFNGDDTLVLTRDGVVVDSFGRVGEDPGDAWLDGNNAEWSTRDKTLRRMSAVTSGDTVVDDAFPGSPNQWQVFDIDTADGLGCPGEGACSSDGGDTDGGPTPSGDPIVITEYVEGGSNNKAVEISNMGSEPVDLEAGQYKLALFTNGDATEHDTRKILLSGILEPGKSFVAYNDSAAEQFKTAEFSAPSEVTFFNGDDAIVLSKAGVVIDVFGRVGEDPGDAWLDANNADWSSQNKTLRRKATVTSGDSVADDAFPGADNQWVVFAQDTADGLGCPGEGACSGGGTGGGNVPDAIENYVLITEYVEGSNSNKAIEITNIGQTDIDLFAEGYRLEAYNNGNSTISNSLNLYGNLVKGSSIVIYNRDAEDAFKKNAPQGIPSNVTFFNGDDAIVLTKGGIAVDSIGQVGFRPAGEWTDPTNDNFSTLNKTLRRQLSVTVGDHIVNDVFPGEVNQWVAFDIDTADGLGCVGELACDGNQPLPGTGIGGGVAIGGCLNCPEISKVASVARYSEADYYGEALHVRSADLPTALNAAISAKHVPLSYSQVWSVLSFSDEDPQNTDNIIELYTGKSIAKMSNGSGPNANDPDSWNREHVWSKSHGFNDDYRYAYTDAHHLRPADWSVNTIRSNKDFDIGGEPLEEAPSNFVDSDSFEPRDEVKGDVARMMFYMATRYNGAAIDKTPDLVLVDHTGTASGSPEFGKLCTLWQWHHDDPVDETEINRNNVVFEYQGNRNPFIDRPDWVDVIFADNCRPATLPVIKFSGQFVVKAGQSVTVDASETTDADGDSLTYHWVQLTDEFISFTSYDSSVTFVAPNVSEDTIIEFQLTVDDGDNYVTDTYQMVVEAKSDSSGVAGGTISYLMLLLLPLLTVRRRLRQR